MSLESSSATLLFTLILTKKGRQLTMIQTPVKYNTAQSLIEKITRIDGMGLTSLNDSEKELLTKPILEHNPKDDFANWVDNIPAEELSSFDIMKLALLTQETMEKESQLLMREVSKIVRQEKYSVSQSDKVRVAEFLLQFKPDHEIALSILTNQSNHYPITVSPVDTTFLMIDAKKYIEMY